MTSHHASGDASIIETAIRGWVGWGSTVLRSILAPRRNKIFSTSSRFFPSLLYLQFFLVFLYLLSLLICRSTCLCINIRSFITAVPKHEAKTATTISWQEYPIIPRHPLPPMLMDGPLPPTFLCPSPPSFTFIYPSPPVSPSHILSATYTPPPHALPLIVLHRDYFYSRSLSVCTFNSSAYNILAFNYYPP